MVAVDKNIVSETWGNMQAEESGEEPQTKAWLWETTVRT